MFLGKIILGIVVFVTLLSISNRLTVEFDIPRLYSITAFVCWLIGYRYILRALETNNTNEIFVTIAVVVLSPVVVILIMKIIKVFFVWVIEGFDS